MDIEDKTPPPVQRNVEVLAKIPQDRQVAGAWLLDPDGPEPTRSVAVQPEVELTGPTDEAGFMHPDTGWAKVSVPELRYWRAVVYEFAP